MSFIRYILWYVWLGLMVAFVLVGAVLFVVGSESIVPKFLALSLVGLTGYFFPDLYAISGKKQKENLP